MGFEPPPSDLEGERDNHSTSPRQIAIEQNQLYINLR